MLSSSNQLASTRDGKTTQISTGREERKAWTIPIALAVPSKPGKSNLVPDGCGDDHDSSAHDVNLVTGGNSPPVSSCQLTGASGGGF